MCCSGKDELWGVNSDDIIYRMKSMYTRYVMGYATLTVKGYLILVIFAKIQQYTSFLPQRIDLSALSHRERGSKNFLGQIPMTQLHQWTLLTPLWNLNQSKYLQMFLKRLGLLVGMSSFRIFERKDSNFMLISNYLRCKYMQIAHYVCKYANKCFECILLVSG